MAAWPAWPRETRQQLGEKGRKKEMNETLERTFGNLRAPKSIHFHRPRIRESVRRLADANPCLYDGQADVASRLRCSGSRQVPPR